MAHWAERAEDSNSEVQARTTLHTARDCLLTVVDDLRTLDHLDREIVELPAF